MLLTFHLFGGVLYGLCRMVLEAIQIRNGISLSVHQRSSYVTLDAYSKGCFQIAPGIVVYNHLLNEYISVFPPLHLYQLHIYDLELLAHVLVAQVWGPQFVSQHVQIFTDNIACFYLVWNGLSAFNNRLRMARLYATLQIHHDYRAEPAWLSTKDNWLADSYSRPADLKCQ